MIPAFMGMAARLSVRLVFVPIVLAALSTGIVLAAQSIARLFADRNP